MYVSRVDHLERDNLCGGNSFSLSQQPLASCSPSSMGGIMWNFTCVHWHVNWYYHYWHWSCSGRLNVETDKCLFPIMSRGHNLSVGVLGIWFLQSFPLPWFFLSLGFKGCISDLYAPVIHFLHFDHVCIFVMVAICCHPKRELLWWGVRAHLSVHMRVGIQKTVLMLL